MAVDDINHHEKLIEAVRKYPCIWDMSSKSYKDSKAKENAWTQVSNEVLYRLKQFSCIALAGSSPQAVTSLLEFLYRLEKKPLSRSV